MLIETANEGEAVRGRRHIPKRRVAAPVVIDDLPASLPVTVAELEAIERHLSELDNIMNAAHVAAASPSRAGTAQTEFVGSSQNLGARR